MFDLEVTMVEQATPRYFRQDVVDSGHRAKSWNISWTPSPSPSLSRSSTKMSFPDLHSAMMDFGKLLSSSTFLDAFSCCATDCQSSQIDAECISVVPTEADRKFAEVQGLSPDQQEAILLRATPACHLAATWTDDRMEACKDFWSSSVAWICW